MVTPELSRPLRADTIGVEPRVEQVTASAGELSALAVRFDLVALERLVAEVTVVRGAAGIRVAGRLAASGAQACVVSTEPVPFAVDDAIDLTFTDASPEADEAELTDLDIVPLDGDVLDLGEVVAQSLGLALDPYPRAPEAIRAAAARFLVSEAEAEAIAAADKAHANPFASLRRPT